MTAPLHGKKVAFLCTDGVEQIELTRPWKDLEGAGAQLELVSLESGQVQGYNHLDKADTFRVDRAINDADGNDYDALVLPGGVANPDDLRTNERAVAFVRDFMEKDKTVAAICHAPWTLVEAGVLKDRTLTSFPSVKTDIKNAGGHWVDEQVHVDKNLITSRKPDDLDAFCAKIIEAMSPAA